MAEIKPVLRSFLAKTQVEKDNVQYHFTIDGDVVFAARPIAARRAPWPIWTTSAGRWVRC